MLKTMIFQHDPSAVNSEKRYFCKLQEVSMKKVLLRLNHHFMMFMGFVGWGCPQSQRGEEQGLFTDVSVPISGLMLT